MGQGPLHWTGERFLKSRFLDATGVLVGQSGGMMNVKSSSSKSSSSGTKNWGLGTAKRSRLMLVKEVMASVHKVPTEVFREAIVKHRYIWRTRDTVISFDTPAFLWPFRGRVKITFTKNQFVRTDVGRI